MSTTDTFVCPRCQHPFFDRVDGETYRCRRCNRRSNPRTGRLIDERPVPVLCPACHAPDPVFYFARKDRRAGAVVIRTSYGCLACRASFTIARPAPTD